MTTPERREQIRLSVARLRARREKAGLVRVTVWAHLEDHQKLKDLAAKLQEKRGLKGV